MTNHPTNPSKQTYRVEVTNSRIKGKVIVSKWLYYGLWAVVLLNTLNMVLSWLS